MKPLRGLGVALGALMLLTACGNNQPVVQKQGNLAIGAEEDAAVTIVEYASVTCPDCAAWHKDVWPAFKAKYVDTKKVRFVLHEFPTQPQDIALAGFLVARCAGDKKYFDVVGQIMAAQPEMTTTPPRDVLLRIASEHGMDEAGFKNCISDPEAVAAIGTRVQEAQALGITGTPTFTLNGERLEDASLANLSSKIDAVLGAEQ